MGRLFSKRRDLKPAQPKEKNQGNSEAPFPAAQKRPNLEVQDQKSPKADKSFASLFKGCGVWGGAPRPYPGEAEKRNQGNSEAPFPAAQKRPNLEVQDQKSPKADKSFASLFKGCGVWGGAPQPYPGEAEKKNQGNSEAPFPAAQKVLNPEGQDSQLIENTMFL